MVHLIVNDKKPIVRFCEKNYVDFGILFIMFLNIQF